MLRGELNNDQMIALAILGIRKGFIKLVPCTGKPGVEEVDKIVKDFSGYVRANREFGDIWEKVGGL